MPSTTADTEEPYRSIWMHLREVEFAQRFVSVDAVRTSVSYQARLTDGLPGAIARAGGADRLKRCGTIYTGAFQVPSVAWYLDEHTTYVQSASMAGGKYLTQPKSRNTTRPSASNR